MRIPTRRTTRRTASDAPQRGFTVLMAVLVSVLILAISGSLVRIVLKQVKFSSSGRESQISYYVADAGIECALLWDFRAFEIFDDGTVDSPVVFPEDDQTIIVDDTSASVIDTVKCGEGSIITNSFPQLASTDGTDYEWIVSYQSDPPGATVAFQILLHDDFDDRDYCGTVVVEKWYDAVEDRVATRVDSRGYNNCDPDPTKRFERGLRVNY